MRQQPAAVYDRAHHYGSVDVGLLLTNRDGAIPSSARHGNPSVYNAEAYSRTGPYATGALRDPQGVAMELLGPFVESLLGEGYSPFAALRLVPFVRLRPAPSSEKNACYFYSRLDGDQAEYVSHHFESESRIHESDPELVAFIDRLDAH